MVLRTVLPKVSSILVIFLKNRVPLKVRNESKLILNDQEGHSDSFRTFRGPLFLKQMIGREFLFGSMVHRDVTTGATSATQFSDTLTLSQPRGRDSANRHRGRS